MKHFTIRFYYPYTINETLTYLIENIFKKFNHFYSSISSVPKDIYIFLPTASFLYILIVGSFSHYSLLYGSDFPGFYSLGDLKINILTPDLIIQALTYVLAYKNLYLSFYLYFFISTYVTFTAIFILSKFFLKEILQVSERTKVLLVFLPYVSILLYTLSPTAIAWTYYSVVNDVSFKYSLFFFFLYLSFRIYLNVERRKSVKFWEIISAAACLSFSAGPAPNGIRVLLVGLVFLLILLVIPILKSCKTIRVRPTISKVVLYLSILIISYLYYLFPIIINPHGFINTMESGAVNLSTSSEYLNTFNTLQNTIRLLAISNWEVNPFRNLYWELSVIFVASWVWPICGLVAPFVILTKKKVKHRFPFLALICLELFVIAMATSYPLEIVTNPIYQIIPFGRELLPPDFLTHYLLTVLYILFSTSFLYLLLEQSLNHGKSFENPEQSIKYMHKYASKTKSKFSKSFGIFITLVITVAFIIAGIPLINGQAYTLTWDGSNNHPMQIPEAYTQAKAILQKDNLTAITLPELSPYITTQFGYKGSVSFFIDYFYPANVVTISNFLGTYSNVSSRDFLSNLSSPLLYCNNTPVINPNWFKDVDKIHANSIIVFNNITSGNVQSYSTINSMINNLTSMNVLTKFISIDDILSIYLINNISQPTTIKYVPIDISLSPYTHPNSSLIYQQVITINKINQLYSGINKQISNIGFFGTKGIPIPGWIQSINDSSIVLWIRLQGEINRTIMLAIYPSWINLLSKFGLLGEAPQLSPIYAQYDNLGRVANNQYVNAFTDFRSSINNTYFSVFGSSIGYSLNKGLIVNNTTERTYFASYKLYDPSPRNGLLIGFKELSTGSSDTYIGDFYYNNESFSRGLYLAPGNCTFTMFSNGSRLSIATNTHLINTLYFWVNQTGRGTFFGFDEKNYSISNKINITSPVYFQISIPLGADIHIYYIAYISALPTKMPSEASM